MTRCCVEATVAPRGRPRRLGAGSIGLLLGLATLAAVESLHQIAWAQDELFVTNSGNDTVTVYARTANGNTAPLRTLQGAATGLSDPTGLAVDSVNSELLVTNATSITVYPRTANGNTAPLRTLTGGATGLSNPFGLAVDSVNNELLVVNATSITVYPRTANGNTAPLRTLTGGATGLSNPFGLAVDSVNNELLVSNEGNDSITVYARTANGNTAPLRTLTGGATGLSVPVGLAVDSVNSELLVTNADSVTVYPRTANGNTAPLRTLTGGATGLSNPFGLAVDSVNNELLVSNEGTNSITVYPRTANGNTAPLRTLAGGATGLSSPQFVAVLRQPFLLSVSILGSGTGTVTSPQGGISCATGNTGTCAANLASGTAVTLTATPTGGASFGGWGGACAGFGTALTCTFSLTAAKSATATFNPAPPAPPSTFALSVSILGSGTGTVTSPQGGISCATGNTGTCAANLASGTAVTLTATPTGGASFGGWGGDCAGFGTALTCTFSLTAAKAATATFNPAAPPAPTPPSPPPSPPSAAVALNGVAFRTGQQLTYQATLTPGSGPTQVDIYLGCLLPDGLTILSLVQVSPGVISIALGPSPTPFLTNVTLAQTVVPFSYTFAGFEPGGTYFPFAGLVVAGTNPFIPANQLSLAVQAFQYSP